MTPDQAQRAGHAQDRALLLGQKIHDEGPDDVQRWILNAFPGIDQAAVDLLIVLAAALPETIAGCARAWSWTDVHRHADRSREAADPPRPPRRHA